MIATAVEVADLIFFEAVAVHDNRVGLVVFLFCFAIFVVGIAFLFGFGFFFFVCGWILENQDQPLAVRRPDKGVYVLNCFGQLLRFPAPAIQQPHLCFTFVAFGEKSQILSVRAPAWMAR